MMIIGCDFHPGFQQIAYVNKETGEYGERRLTHPAEAQAFYRALAGRQVRVGMEATGNFRWFRRLLGELGHEALLGDPAKSLFTIFGPDQPQSSRWLLTDTC
jgi:transposase